MPNTYEEQQKLLRAQVPQGTAGATELASQGFTDVGIDTSQPSPQTVQIQPPMGLTKVPTEGVGPQGEQIFDVFSGQEHIQDPNDPRLKGVNIPNLPTGTAPGGFQSKFAKGFSDANAAGVGDVSGAGEANAIVNQYASPSKKNDLSSVFVQNDEFMNSLVTAWQEYIKPESQRKSLAETYKQMTKESGVEALDLELVNMKSVLEGSEDDIRTEITKAGGFATESQVLGLTNARNKQLIKDYNRLVDTRNAKEKYLQTAIGLEQADRQAADQRFESMFNMGIQIANYQQQMQQNARNQMQWLTQNLGFDGLYDATGGDPYYMNLVERTLGLPQGGLVNAARQAQATKVRAEEERQLGLQEQRLGIQLKGEQVKMAPLERQLKGEQIKTEQAQRAKIVADTQKITDASKGTIFDLSTPEGQKQAALSRSQIDQVGSILTSGNLKTAVGPNVFSRFGKIRSILTPGVNNFIANVEQIRSQLNLQSLIDAKAKGATFGALSDQELRVLSNAATKLGSWAVGDKDQFGNITNVTGYKVKE